MVFDVLVISAFQRGDWLATTLKEKNLKIAVLDMSYLLEDKGEEDPFGYFLSYELQNSQIHFLESFCKTKKESFQILLKEGPFKAGHQLTDFWLSQSEFQPSWDYLWACSYSSEEEKKRLKKEVEKSSFTVSWLSFLSHTLASSVYCDSYEKLQGKPLLFCDTWCRREKRGRFDDKSFLEKQGVLVLTPKKTLSFFKKGRRKKIQFDDLGQMEARHLVVSLNHKELEKIGIPLKTSYESKKPLLLWAKMSVNSSVWEKEWGDHFLWLLNKEFSWTHENLCVIQNLGDSLDIWLRLPYAFQETQYKDRLLDTQAQLLRHFESKMPQGSLKVLQNLTCMPSLPVWKEGEKRKTQISSGIWWDSVECSRRLDWQGRFFHQEKILKEMKL